MKRTSSLLYAATIKRRFLKHVELPGELERDDVVNKVTGEVTLPETNECWRWTGAQHGKGYGHFKIGSDTCKSHKVTYRLFKGEIPEDAECVRHTCGRSWCVNPRHVLPSSFKENSRDMIVLNEKGQLSREDVYEIIRRRHVEGHVYKSIAEDYNLSTGYIHGVANGKHYQHYGITVEDVINEAEDEDEDRSA